MEVLQSWPQETTRAWVGVASREHVQIGVEGGFAQFCHGKAAPARRPRKGDAVVYYSAKEVFGQTLPCQRFTAFGIVEDDTPVSVEQFPGFFPWRRQVRWLHRRETPIQPLLGRLRFIEDPRHWGAPFRFGFLEIPQADLITIGTLMGAFDTDPYLGVPKS